MKRALSRKNLWESLPKGCKRVLGSAMACVPLPWLLGGNFRKWYRFVEESQWWSEDQIHAYQMERLKAIVTLAYEKTVYYRKSFDSVGFKPGDLNEPADLRGLPTIDKKTIRENLPDMTALPIGSPSVDYMSTSGTGGTPLGFHIGSDRSGPEFSHLSQSWARVGYRPGMTLAVLRGNVIEADASGLYHQYDPLLRHHVYSSFHLTPESMGRYVDHMHRVRPRFLHAYPSSAYILARFMSDHGLAFPPGLAAILLESEPVYGYQRQFINDKFPVRIYSSYGHTEKLVLAAECEHSTAYHVWPTYGYCELLDEDDGPVTTPGRRCEIVGTGFINTVVPFIRYRTDDFSSYIGNRCPQCGRAHVVLDGIEAHRSQEFLVTKDHRTIVAWTALNMHDDTFDGVGQFQFVQSIAGEADLNLVPTSGGAPYDLARIQGHLQSKLRGLIDVRLHVRDQIPPNRSGKKPIVIQRVPNIEELIHAVSDATQTNGGRP